MFEECNRVFEEFAEKVYFHEGISEGKNM